MKWTNEKIESELLKCISSLQINRMPTANEIRFILGRNDLHMAIQRGRKYSGWAEYLGLSRKESETVKGQRHEEIVMKRLVNKGYSVERMSTKHPYDLLVNGLVKVDVKAGKAYMLHGSRAHSFGISKKEPTCDIYIILAIDEQDEVERTFIIPSHLLRVVTLCIGKESKYNKFIDRWDLIERYSTFLKDVV